VRSAGKEREQPFVNMWFRGRPYWGLLGILADHPRGASLKENFGGGRSRSRRAIEKVGSPHTLANWTLGGGSRLSGKGRGGGVRRRGAHERSNLEGDETDRFR